MHNKIPERMQAITIPTYDTKRKNLVLVEKPVPKPGPNEVLIKVSASPINPSDVVFLEGRYGIKKRLPVVPGFEGSGHVVASGGGVIANALVGRRVACGAPNRGDGLWAQYMVTQADSCMPLLPSVTNVQGAMALANPLTAWAMLAIARQENHRGLVQSAALSAVGQMVLRLGQQFNLTIVNIVRRPEQVAHLQSLGAKHILNSNTYTFVQDLQKLCHDLNITLALDAVAGDLAGHLLKAMPRGSKLISYGALSNKACLVNPEALIFQDKIITGFWLTRWLRQLGFVKRLQVGIAIQRRLGTTLQTTIQARLPLAQAAYGLNLYTENMSNGKVLLTPNE